MRLKQLILKDFGPFDDRTITFNPGFTILFGRNEAGKSTLLHAVRAAFFGSASRKIGDKNVRTLDGWLNARPTTSVEVFSELADGSPLSFLRTNSTKTPVDGTIAARPIDVDQLGRLLDIDATQFRNIYGFTLEELRAGQQSLTDASVTEVLFGGGLGRLASFRALQKQIDKRAGELFKSRGKNQPVNAQLTAVHETAAQLRDKTVTPQHYDELTTQIADAEAQASELEMRASELTHQLRHLDRLDRVADLVDQRTSVRASQEALALDPPLAEAHLDSVDRALDRIDEIEPRIEDAERSLKRIEAELAGLTEHPKLATVAAAVDDLASQLPLVAEARRRARETELELSEIDQQLATQEFDPDTMPTGLPTDTALRLDDWETRRTSLQVAHRDHSADLARTRRDLAELEQLIDSSVDVAEESAVLTAAAMMADVQSSRSHREALRRRYDHRQGQLQRRAADLAAAIGWDEWLADRPALPPISVVDSAQEALAQLQSRREAITQELSRLGKEKQRLSDDLELLRSNPDIASVAELSDAREERDKISEELRGRLGDSELDRQKLTEVSEDLSEATLSADQLADRIIANSREAARIAEVEKKFAFAQRDRQQAQLSLDDVESKLAGWQDDWASLWHAITEKPLSPERSSQWLEQITSYEEDLFRLESESTELAQLDEQAQTVEQRLIELIPEDLRGADSAVMQTWLQNEADSVRDQRSERRRAEQTRPTLIATANEQQQDLDVIASQIDAIDAEFAAWKSEHGVGASIGFKDLRELIDAESLSEQLRRQSESARKRLDQAKRLVDNFEVGVAEVRNQSGDTVDDIAAADWVAAAHSRLDAHREASARKKSLLEQKSEIRVQLTELTGELTDTTEKVASVVDGFETQARQETRLLVQKSNDYWAANAECRRLEELIAAIVSDGQETSAHATPLDGAIAELASSDAAIRREQRASLQQSRDEEQAELKAVQSNVAVLRKEQQSLSRGERLAELQVQLESERAQLRDAIDQYAPLVLLQSMLDRAIDSFGRTVRPELLDRVCDLFQRLTDGDYVAIERRLDAESLRVQTSDGIWKVSSQLSTGTRELLYLAVRLAFIEERHRSHESLPLILDDVLVNIDAIRARAVLGTLAQLSQSTQVVLLTCRPELVLLLRSLGYGDAVHEMSDGDVEQSLGVLQSTSSNLKTADPFLDGVEANDQTPRQSHDRTGDANAGLSQHDSASKESKRRKSTEPSDLDQPDLFATNAEV